MQRVARKRHEVGHDRAQVVRGHVDSGADGGAAQVHGAHLTLHRGDALLAACHHRRIAVERLAQAHGNCVLKLRATHLEHVVELVRLAVELSAQCFEALLERAEQVEHRKLASGGDDVVGRLSHVHVVVGVHGRIVAQGVAEHLARAVRKNLVHVHVRARTSATLDIVDNELIGKATSHDLFASSDDGRGLLLLKAASRAVGNGRGLLHQGKVADEHRVHRLSSNGEVALRTQRLHAVVGIDWNIHLANRVLLTTRDGCTGQSLHRCLHRGGVNALNVLAHTVSF